MGSRGWGIVVCTRGTGAAVRGGGGLVRKGKSADALRIYTIWGRLFEWFGTVSDGCGKLLLKESKKVVVGNSRETRGLLDKVPVRADVVEGIHGSRMRKLSGLDSRVRYKVTQPGVCGRLRLRRVGYLGTRVVADGVGIAQGVQGRRKGKERDEWWTLEGEEDSGKAERETPWQAAGLSFSISGAP